MAERSSNASPVINKSKSPVINSTSPNLPVILSPFRLMAMMAASYFPRKLVSFTIFPIKSELEEITISFTSMLSFFESRVESGNSIPLFVLINSKMVDVSPAKINLSLASRLCLGLTGAILSSPRMISTRNNPCNFLSPASSTVFPMRGELDFKKVSVTYSRDFSRKDERASFLSGKRLGPKKAMYKIPTTATEIPTKVKSNIPNEG